MPELKLRFVISLQARVERPDPVSPVVDVKAIPILEFSSATLDGFVENLHRVRTQNFGAGCIAAADVDKIVAQVRKLAQELSVAKG